MGWACATANGAENTLQWLMRPCETQMIVLSATAFQAAEEDPSNLKLCPRGAGQDLLLVETVLSMRTIVCHCKKVMHRVWAYGSPWLPGCWRCSCSSFEWIEPRHR